MNLKKMKTYITLFTLLLCCVSIHAVDIKGRLIDSKTKEPVEFATTVLLKSDSTYVSGAQSDSLGVFDIGGQFIKQDYLLRATFLGYKTTYVQLKNLAASVDLGDIELSEDSKLLGEVTVTGNRIINKVDRQIIMPDSMQIKSSTNAFELLEHMSLARLNIDPVNRTIKVANEEVQLRINGVRATIEEVIALRPQDILRVEYFEDPGVRFGDENVGAVVDIIVDRSAQTGGYVAVDGRNAPFVGFGDDNLTFKINNKASEFGLNYNASYRSYDDMWINQTQTFNFPNNPVVRDEQGIKQPFQYQYHRLNLSYNLTVPDKRVFNIILKNQIFDKKNDAASNIFYSNSLRQTHTQSNAKFNEYMPVLDIFYKQELKSKQSIALNVVGTYINSSSENKFVEREGDVLIFDILNEVDGRKYSLISEIVYSKEFDKTSISGGAKHTQGYADNSYSGNNTIKTNMKNAESYVFAQVQGKIAGKLGYTLGVGGSRMWFQEGTNDITFYTVRPSLQFNYPVNDNLNLKYNLRAFTRTPSLGQLSNVEQQIDTYQINRGNPSLEPGNVYRNTFSISYNKGIFSANTDLEYWYFHRPLADSHFIEGDKVITMRENQRALNYYAVNSDLTLKIIKDIWSVNAWFRYVKENFKNNTGTNNYDMIFGGFRSNLQYKNYSLVVGAESRYKELWGQTIYYGEDWNYVEAGYKHKEAKLSLGMSYPFKDYWSSGSRNISAVMPSESWSYIGGNGRMLYVRFAWNMSFGRKHKAAEKSLENADTDKGTL